MKIFNWTVPQKTAVEITATIFVFTIAIGGIFVPELGLALAGLMAAAIVMTLRKPRSFCSTLCPRGKALGFIMRGTTKRRALPKFMLTLKFRRLLCGAMMFCVIGNLARSGGTLPAVGLVFWVLCILSLTAGLILGFFFKPRAWCAICPMGTLQDTISKR
ncbi:MAG: 4Fe-4S binding protein [Spirochaetia bacterium]|jgi:polyferredoxin|nr:4Fe-4S binding protein [Spirochaetales bacterium]MDX9784141.1 4Fe-4S binding protein [Spirochaetia bacterium]